jgi:peptide/nickel transport system ATP-binding protein
VLFDVSFELHPRQILALVGESGSGKSTVARVLAGLTPPSAGSVEFQGRTVLSRKQRATLEYRRHVQMVFQDPFASLNPVHHVRHHLQRPLVRHDIVRGKAAIAERVHELLTTVGLTPSADFMGKYPHELSGGQRQRVAIARALAVEPKLILADEPTSMLDVSIRIGILNLLRELQKSRGLSCLFITHDLASARYLADRTMVMFAGRIVEQAPTETLLTRPAHPYTKLLLDSAPDPNRRARAPEHDAPAPVRGSVGPRTQVGDRGCAFRYRCPNAIDVCSTRSPETQALTGNHSVNCHAPLIDLGTAAK